CQQNDNWARTF
nr:immunoglobulin light chain junction region [Macaca mulatta]MOV79593.1 immunoglobulin light chain junction region [Macaca mulatta]MOV81477.1 immunoglobulin light chain junction region [Macaca mulatta]MOV83628.1 immunoglobulin light chain junction region [Macaca mulatta]MOV83734.1 immunoglobulin light chain junction region [Macaca mulatta]